VKLVDNSSGFWTDVIIRRINPDMVIRQHFEPSIELMTILGNEMISSVKGSVKHNITVGMSNEGQKTIHSFPSGSYQYGIMKQTDPDGNPLAPLSDNTIRIRREEKQNNRGYAFILRETSQHIFEGLKIKVLNLKSVVIGWTGEDEQRVTENANEREVENPAITYWHVNAKKKTVTVPARDVRGLSDEFRENFLHIMRVYMGLE
jgi:hypothetical protein